MVTVIELIRALEVFDPSAVVYRADGEYGPLPATGVAQGLLARPDRVGSERRTLPDAHGMSITIATRIPQSPVLAVIVGDGDLGDFEDFR